MLKGIGGQWAASREGGCEWGACSAVLVRSGAQHAPAGYFAVCRNITRHATRSPEGGVKEGGVLQQRALQPEVRMVRMDCSNPQALAAQQAQPSQQLEPNQSVRRSLNAGPEPHLAGTARFIAPTSTTLQIDLRP